MAIISKASVSTFTKAENFLFEHEYDIYDTNMTQL